MVGTYISSGNTSRLAHINILLIDPDKELSVIIRNILKSLGFNTIHIARDGAAALEIIIKNTIDLIITDWLMQPMDGLTFITKVRTDKLSANPMVPIIMLTAQAKRWNVEMARDTGITEFMVKPFTVKQLCDKMIQVIDHPRSFIVSPLYTGPDRRRKTVPFDVNKDRRHFNDDINIATYKKEDWHKAKEEEDVFLIDTDYELKEKIGGFISAAELFSDANIKKAQKIIHEARGDFLNWFVSDLKELEKAFEGCQKNSPAGIELMKAASLRIKGRAGTFGYDLASAVADSLHDITMHIEQNSDEKALKIFRKHIDAMYVIIQRNITGDGGQIGKELMRSLLLLSQKYINKN